MNTRIPAAQQGSEFHHIFSPKTKGEQKMTTNYQIQPEQIEQDKIYKELGLTDKEYELIKEKLDRRPNFVEIGLFSAMWSEHCSYKTSKPLLRKFPTKAPQVLMGPGEGAGVVDIGDNLAVVFKIESHNSPSAVEPFEGAATGVGGIIRDVFSIGAKPIAALNSLRFGNLDNAKDKELFSEVIRGIAYYGNEIGVPTVGGEVQFDASYHEKPLVNAMVVGLLKHDEIRKGLADGPGNIVLYAGAPTGRDGIGGAAFSSSEVDVEEDNKSAVAIGDPQVETRLIAACLEACKSDALIGIQDMGAAGLTSSSSEMAAKSGTGIEMNMDLVPTREENMNAYELMLSESQERMLLVVQQGREKEIIDIFEKHDIPAIAIGQVIEEKTLRLIEKGEVVCELPVEALADEVPTNHLPSKEAAYYKEFQAQEGTVPAVDSHAETLKKLLQQPTIASKEWAYSQFDTEAGGNTVFGPGSDAAVVRIEGTNKAIAITTDCNSRYIYVDPEVGGKIAIAEAARNIVASGAKPLALTDGLNYGDPTNPEVFWQLEKSVDGLVAACEALETPVVSGNVSLYNQSQGKPIFPTPIIGMVGLFESMEHITPSQFQRAGDAVYLIGETYAEFGGSELQNITDGAYSGKAPALDLKTEAKRQKQLLKAIQSGLVQSAHDLAEGGLGVALAESTFSDKKLGASVELSGDATVLLFSESQSRFLVSVKPEDKEKFAAIVETAQEIGTVEDKPVLQVKVNGDLVVEEDSEKLNTLWKEAIPSLLKS